MELTKEYLRSIFDYEETGHLRWKVKKGKRTDLIGKIAGCISLVRSDLRRVVVLNGKGIFNAQLIFIYHKGYLPECIDHKDRNALNDKIDNLRAATKAQNNRNKSSAKNSTSKYLGVYKRNDNGKWRSEIRINKKRISIGTFTSEIDAAKAYNNLAIIHYGEFANLNIIT